MASSFAIISGRDPRYTGIGSFTANLSGTAGGSPLRSLTTGGLAEWLPGIMGVARDLCFTPNAEVEAGEAPTGSIDPPFPPVWPYFFSTGILYGKDEMRNIEMYRGDTPDIDVTVTKDGVAANLTGGTLRFTAKWKTQDVDVSAVFTRTSPATGIVFTDAINGKARISFAASNTSGLPAHRVDLLYDLQFTDSGGKIFTVLAGMLIVKPDISVTTP